ncbi:hypothetical protein [Brotaphodocola sp.]|uniref:hypothetical protein n=1 Tax=Brotaphodocola sp. TaxID=3073577 RepID=UPI003D7F0B02
MSKRIYLMKFSGSFKRGGIRKNPAPFLYDRKFGIGGKMSLPEFLRRENRVEASEKEKQLDRLMEEYRVHFGERPTNEPSVYNEDEWIEILQKCISDGITVYELLDGELETTSDYDCVIIKRQSSANN